MDRPTSARAYSRLPICLQNVVCALASVRKGRKWHSRRFRKTLAWLEEADKWPLGRLREYQDRRLREIVSHCYQTVPFYRQQFHELGITPEDIRKVEDLQALPILSKEVVRANRYSLISSVFNRSSLRRGRTSGTTGAGMEVFHEPASLAFQDAVLWRFRRRFGFQLEDRHAHFGGRPIVPRSQKKPPFWRHRWPLHQTYFSSYHMTKENLRHYYDYLSSRYYVYYTGYPSTISILAEFMVDGALRLPRPPRAVSTGSETLLPNQARLIGQALDCPVVDHYGAAEGVCNLSRCPAGLYHEDMEFGIIERHVLERTAEGTTARMIATGLVDMAMPLLRYDTGDLATFVEGPCSCGRSSPIALRIDGRIEGRIITPDGRRIGRMARVFADMLTVRESQIVQDRLDHLTVRVVKSPQYTDRDEGLFRRCIHDIVGPEMQVSFQYVDRVPREKNGKLRAVISLVSEGDQA